MQEMEAPHFGSFFHVINVAGQRLAVNDSVLVGLRSGKLYWQHYQAKMKFSVTAHSLHRKLSMCHRK